MAFDKTAASDALKEFYLPVQRELLVNNNEYLMQIERNTEDVEGLEAVMSLHVGRNWGIGARQEMEDLPPAGNQAYKKARVGLKYNYAQFQISGPVIRASKSDKGSWIRALESEQKGVTNDLKNDYERQLLGTSDGVICATGVTGASTTVVTAATTTQIRQIKKGMRIDIGTVASPTAIAQNRTIQSVNTTAKTFVISGAAVTTAVTDRIFINGNGGDGANQREVTGAQTIVDSTGSLFGVDPATYPEWASYEKDAAGAALSDALVGELIDEISINSPAGVPNWAFTSHSQARKYAATLVTQRRYTNEVDLKAGFKGIEIGTGSGTLALSTLRDAPAEQLFAVNTEHLIEFRASDWEYMEEDGSVLQRVQTGNGKDAYGGTLFLYSEQSTDMRSAHGKITGLAA